MNFKFIVLSFLLIINSISLFSKEIKVKLYSGDNVENVSFTTQNGKYLLYSDTTFIDTLFSNTNINIKLQDNKLIAQINNNEKLIVNSIFLQSCNASSFFLNHSKSNKKARALEGSIIFQVKDNNISIINIIDLESYVQAVVEAEAGYNHHIEYYKTQAIICRTYAINNENKHIHEDANLCDDVHCQYYPNKARRKEIIEATKSTEGIVIVDTNLNIISATYHSNSGGRTMNSEDVWQSSLPYLKSVDDSISLLGKNAFWEKEISAESWKLFLQKYQIDTSKSIKYLVWDKHENCKFYSIDNIRIRAKDFRTEFSLKSAHFYPIIKGNSIILKGRGYGHGVGLSQEGAMILAKKGYTYKQILEHYYNEIYLMNINTVNMFNEVEF